MTGTLVELYNLPESLPAFPALEEQGIRLRRPMASEKSQVVDWVREHFDVIFQVRDHRLDRAAGML